MQVDPAIDSYFKIIEAWKVEERTKERLEELSRSSTAVFGRSQRNVTGGMASVPFKVVVESFAAKHGVAFAPKFGTGSKLPDGRSLWQFGKSSCYLDQDVVFVEKSVGGKSSWSPVSLEDLLQMSS